MRLVYILVVLVGISLFVFLLSRLQGDPRDLFLNDYATQEQYDAWGERMGLDKPLAVQYLVWLGKALRGDFGMSLAHRQPALDVVMQRMPATLQLSAVGIVVCLLASIPLNSVCCKEGYPGRLWGTYFRFSRGSIAWFLGWDNADIDFFCAA